ncbi:MAG: choice-of-anchor D domain-containing protein [Polyangiaceae bacterium]
MFHLSFFSDAQMRVRPDLRAEGLDDFARLPLAGGFLWVSAGPHHGLTDDGDTPPRMANGGLVSSIALEPSNPDRIVFGTRAGGVWRTVDGGTTWHARGDGLPSLQTVAVSVTERSGQPPIVVAGTGALNEEKRRHAGLLGAFRSVDGGDSWSSLDGGPGATVFRSHDINRVVSVDESRVLVASRVGLFFSKDGGRNFGQNDPEYDDGMPVLRGDVTDLVVTGNEVAAVISLEPPAANDPRPPEVGWQVTTLEEPGVYTGVLGGVGFSTAMRQTHRTRAAVADPDVGLTRLARAGDHWLMSAAKLEVPADTFAQISLIRGTGPNANPHHSIQITHAAFPPAAGWETLPRTDVAPAQTDFSHVIALEPSADANRVNGWFGTVRMFRTAARKTGGHWRWSSATESGTDDGRVGMHVDQHAIVVDGSRVFAGNDGGIYRTTDSGAHWTPLNAHNAFMMWTINLAKNAAGEALILAGVQDNGTFIGQGPFDPSTGTWSWQATGPGDGGPSAWEPRATDRQPTDDPQSAIITFNGVIARAAGTAVGSWSSPDDVTFRPGLDITAGDIAQGFIYSETVALARGPAGAWDRVYFGRSDSRHGPGTLFRGEAGATATDVGGARAAVISALAAAPHAAPTDPWNELWFGLVNGEIFHSSDAGVTTTPVTVAGAFTGTRARPITAIAVDPEDSRRVAIVFGGYAETGRRESARKVFLTEDKGGTWRDISGTPESADGFVPDIPVLGAAFTRTTPVSLILATDLGVLITHGPTFGARWERLGVGLPKCPIPALALLNPDPGDNAAAFDVGTVHVAVTAFGRGAFLLTRPTSGRLFIELDGGFGAMRVGEARRRRLTVHNVGATPVTLDSLSAPAPFSFVAGPDDPSPGLVVPARASVSWEVVCSPPSAGIVLANLSVGPTGSVQSIPVSCEAFAGGKPRLSIERRNLRFGPVPHGVSPAATEDVVLRNTGQAPLRIEHIRAVAGGSAQLTVEGDGFDADPASPPALTLAPGASAVLHVRFAASGEGTDQETSFLVTSNDPITADGHRRIAAHGSVGAAIPTPPPSDDEGGVPVWGWVIIGVVAAAVVGVGIGLGVAAANDDL